jgi:UrcA family protein
MYSSEQSVTKTLRVLWAMAGSAALVWSGGSAAQAAEPSNVVAHKVVSYRDLNLNNSEGIDVLYKRIRSAAHDVCADPLRYDLSESKLKPCIDDAMSRAIEQVNSPMLTSLYQSKGGKVDKKVSTLAKAQ